MADKKEQFTFLQAMKSVFAGFFGVQSNRQRTKDFSHGKPIYFILAGFIVTFVFVISLIIFVKFLVAV